MASDDVKVSGLDFGVIIAFVAPGFVALQATSYYTSVTQAWMAAASDKDPGVGVFLFVLLGSLSMGLIVSGIRALLIDNLLRSHLLLRRFAIPPNKLDWSKVEEKNLLVLLTIRDGFYRHYQFYANTFVAVLLWSFSHAFASGLQRQYWALIAAVLCALFLSARSSLRQYVLAVNQVFK